MCGIVGGFLPRDLGASEIEAAVKSIEHRGPDEQNSWTDGNAFLGICRLSIIDLAGGSQPIWNEDETEVHRLQRRAVQLPGPSPPARRQGPRVQDGHGHRSGSACLRGMGNRLSLRTSTACSRLAIWDVKTESMFIARDRIGEKPLYYFRSGETLLFASEIKALLQFSAVPRR